MVFASLVHARDQIRSDNGQVTSNAGFTFHIRGGSTILSTTFKLTQEGSGRTDSPFVWQASQNGQPNLIGGQRYMEKRDKLLIVWDNKFARLW